MTLQKETVRQIIRVVADDPDCKKRTNSKLRFIDIADSGLAGSVRNTAIGLVYGLLPDKYDDNFDSGDWSSMAYEYSCDGIAEVTSIAINKKLDAIPALKRAYEQGRVKGFSHTGTLLEMKDDSKYVLDWWKSLNIHCPFVFRFQDFMYKRSDGTPYTSFEGFMD